MGQGSINQAPQGRSPMEGIMQALQAVQAYYGLDTQKAQQRLLDLQQQKEEAQLPAVKAASDLAISRTNLNKQSTDKAAQYLKGGDPQAPASPLSQFTQPQAQPVAQAQPAQSAQPQTQQKPANMRDFVNSEIQAGNYVDPDLVAPFEKQQEYLNKQTEGGLKENELGAQRKKLSQEETARSLGNQEKALGLKKTQYEVGMLPAKDMGEVAKQFSADDIVKSAKSDLANATSISTMITSGNKISQQLGQEKLALLGAGVKRLSEQVMAGSEDQALLARLSNKLSKGQTGQLTVRELHLLNQAAGVMAQTAADTLNRTAADFSATHGKILGIDPNKIQSILLPNGANPQTTETTIVKHPHSGVETLFKRGKKQGTWDEVVGGE